MRDLYVVLGVERSADAQEIKRAYRDLTRRFHPDVHRGRAWAGEFYREIVDAYAILGDGRARALYDEFGELSLTRGFDPSRARAHRQRTQASEPSAAPPGPWSSSPPPPEPPASEPAEELDFDDLRHARRTVFDDILSAIWRGREVRIEDLDEDDGGTGRDARAEVSVPLARAVVGCTLQIRVRDPAAPSGARIVDVPIPAGIDDGAVVTIAGAGEGGHPPGDLHVAVRVIPSPTLTRDGLDLHLDVAVTLLELYRGGAIDVSTPRGVVAVQVPPACAPERTLRLRGQGVQLDGSAGDLLLRLRVQMPPAGDAELLRVLERIQGGVRAR